MDTEKTEMKTTDIPSGTPVSQLSIGDIVVVINQRLSNTSICAKIAYKYNLTGKVVEIINDCMHGYVRVDFNLTDIVYISAAAIKLIITAADIELQTRNGDF